MTKAISASEFWEESQCVACQKRILRGEPRCIIMFVDLGIGPGHQLYSEMASIDEVFANDEDYSTPETGLAPNLSTAVAFCCPCAGESKTIEILNPWYARQQEKLATGGSSVHTIPLSQMAIDSSDLDGDNHVGGRDVQVTVARAEAEDRFISLRAESSPRVAPTHDDVRNRMAVFLQTGQASRVPYRMRKVLELWSKGIKQQEIEKATGVDQSTVSRLIRQGRSLLYSSRAR